MQSIMFIWSAHFLQVLVCRRSIFSCYVLCSL